MQSLTEDQKLLAQAKTAIEDVQSRIEKPVTNPDAEMQDESQAQPDLKEKANQENIPLNPALLQDQSAAAQDPQAAFKQCLKALTDKKWSTLFQVRQNLQRIQDVWLPAAKNLTDT